jgi:hypothetical protein
MTALDSKTRDLPIFKHFTEGEISSDSFRKGFINEKTLFTVIKLGALVGVAVLAWMYVLPQVFIMLGRYIAIAITGVAFIATIMALPVIIKGLRMFTRGLHKILINYDPFAELERQKELMIQNQTTFRVAKGKILSLKSECEVEADKNEKDGKKLQNKILVLNDKAKSLKTQMDDMVKNGGIAAKGEDDYVNANADLFKIVSESGRVSAQLKQAQDFVTKYGVRANIMKKFGQKLTMVETSMDIKVLDFEATIEILKKDYDFAQKGKTATEAAKEAMLFTKGWELEYALDVVTTTIASDISITAGNLKDIDSLTKNYAVDSDELYANLDSLANNIRIGTEVVPEAKKYSNPEYQLTQQDKVNSGGFENIF